MSRKKCLACGKYQSKHEQDEREFCDILIAQWRRDAMERMGFRV